MNDAEREAVRLLVRLPAMGKFESRTALLHAALPSAIVDNLDRDQGSKGTDWTNVVEQLSRLGRLKDGTRPVILVVEAARADVEGTELGVALEEAVAALRRAYGTAPVPA